MKSSFNFDNDPRGHAYETIGLV